jgi:hypothetical protein
MAKYCESRRTGIDVEGDYCQLWGGPNAIVRRLLEDEDIADAVERNEVIGDCIYDGEYDKCITYWQRRGTCDPLMKGIVYGIHRIRDTIGRKRKREPDETERCEKRESRRVAEQNKRAELRGNEANLTDDEWAKIRSSFLNECAYCSSNRGLGMDHIIPVSNGGGTTRTNVVPCCKMCNSTKGPRTAEWLIGENAIAGIVDRLESINHD